MKVPSNVTMESQARYEEITGTTHRTVHGEMGVCSIRSHWETDESENEGQEEIVWREVEYDPDDEDNTVPFVEEN